MVYLLLCYILLPKKYVSIRWYEEWSFLRSTAFPETCGSVIHGFVNAPPAVLLSATDIACPRPVTRVGKWLAPAIDSVGLCKCHIFGGSSGRKDAIWFKPLDFWTINCRKTNMKTWSQTSQELDPPRIFVVPEFLASFLRSTWESHVRWESSKRTPRKWAAEWDGSAETPSHGPHLTQAAMFTDNNATNYTAKKGKYGAE